ncbi:hypothetical protein [Acinetobacter baumannii]|uniref:hypothetical protein n=1 Tax=Acinetobacter baumannii TaxID=470 RepID=UPI000BF2E97D|nr:hypothetical protein [Acinetobacter baumannii]MDC4638823.1 hypothetical protein [Acinetobacter baumannii]WCS38464.1 hypothetical protein OSV60_01070 [Acinetobacter baumannii]
METIKEILTLVTLPDILRMILEWLVGLVLIDSLLQKLTKKKFSLEIFLKFVLEALREGVKLREGIQPLNINRRVKKLFSYFICGVWAYGCLIFIAFLISSIIMFVLRKNDITIEKVVLVWGIILMYGWAARFAYVETRIALKNAKSI